MPGVLMVITRLSPLVSTDPHQQYSAGFKVPCPYCGKKFHPATLVSGAGASTTRVLVLPKIINMNILKTLYSSTTRVLLGYWFTSTRTRVFSTQSPAGEWGIDPAQGHILPRKILVKPHVSQQGFSDMTFEWLAALQAFILISYSGVGLQWNKVSIKFKLQWIKPWGNGPQVDWWYMFSPRLQYIPNISNGNTSVLCWAFDVICFWSV